LSTPHLSATRTDNKHVALSWTASNGTGLSYWIYRNGVQIAAMPGLTFTDWNAASAQYYVVAHDRSGHTSAKSNLVTVN